MPATSTSSRPRRQSLAAFAALPLLAACAFVFRPADNGEISDLADSVAAASVALECQMMLPTEDAETPARTGTMAGSGVIVSEDGLIVTNNHVVAGAVSVVVTLYNGERMSARVVGSDAKMDLAVLKVRAKRLPFLRIGRAEDLKRGQRVVSLGNGLGLGRNGDLAVTSGVVSGVRRSIAPGIAWCEMDAPIYPGCSGGPVCDMSGRVVGINVALSNYLKPFFIPLDAASRASLSKMSGGRISA